MDNHSYLIDATATFPNGTIVKGPVTTEDNSIYLFRNKWSSYDFYIYIAKANNGDWFKKDGQSISTPETVIKELGRQIDEYLVKNK